MSVYFTQCFGGGLLNILVVCLILGHRRLRTGCGLLIAHCLIAHTALCMLFFPLSTITVYGRLVAHWDYDASAYCNTFMFLQVATRHVSNWLEVYVAANRLVALCFPFKYRNFAKEKLENEIVAVIWFLGYALAFLGIYEIGTYYFSLPNGACGYLQKTSWGMLTFVAGNWLPLAIAAAGYAIIYIRMLANNFKRRRTFALENASQQDRSAEKSRLSKANMVFMAFFWNSVCYLVFPVMTAVAPQIPFRIPVVPLAMGNVQILGYTTNPKIC
ncbi:nociceptin receptor-like [Paramacrobiotus metropolitanus]|uniref:nociceptin receptor-like n=1 Tax=Paramacrobiotus metropolitanus TaxID=2943436 RepID=UPI002445649D|nr:nociceptin receptor-like [Paramacrobiotus metropolitanus]